MIYVLGAGGHGAVVADIIRRKGEQPYFFDDTKGEHPPIKAIHGMEFLPAVVAIGDNYDRMNVFVTLPEGQRISVIHPETTIAKDVKIGKGTVICAGAIIQPGAVIGNNVIINTGSTVDHHCIIEDHAHIAPGANLGGGVKVREGALVGIGAAVLPGADVKPWRIVKAGSLYENPHEFAGYYRRRDSGGKSRTWK